MRRLPRVTQEPGYRVVLHIAPGLQYLVGLITINMFGGLRCFPTGRKETPLASLTAKAYAEISI